MSTRLPPVLSVDDLPLPELLAARLDGELFRVDDCFSPIDEIEQPLHRARALAAGLPPRLIAEQRSAAWIWGALDAPPRPHQLCAGVGARVRVSGHGRLVAREVVITHEDTVQLGPLFVTTPLRTVLDLARFSPHFDLDERTMAKKLLSIGEFDVERCLVELEARRNLPKKRLAALRLSTLALR